MVNSVTKKYKDMQLSDYSLNPPREIFEKLDKVETTSEIYSST